MKKQKDDILALYYEIVFVFEKENAASIAATARWF